MRRSKRPGEARASLGPGAAADWFLRDAPRHETRPLHSAPTDVNTEEFRPLQHFVTVKNECFPRETEILK